MHIYDSEGNTVYENEFINYEMYAAYGYDFG